MTRVTIQGVRRKKNNALRSQRIFVIRRLILSSIAGTILLFFLLNWSRQQALLPATDLASQRPSLVMKGGDPYIRALMRTISASESNVAKPYAVIYGGRYVSDLSRHPNQCVTIVNGPNRGNCTTAAGRYQFLSSTWLEKAKRYHPEPTHFLFWKEYSFEPEYQDRVVYAWLSDRKYWKADISKLLQQGDLDRVLRLLSGTWTSLGYGIEDNSMTGYLPKIYEEVLQEELKKSR